MFQKIKKSFNVLFIYLKGAKENSFCIKNKINKIE